MRHARRTARAAVVGSVLAALLVSLLPAVPAVAQGSVKVTGRRVQTSVDHSRVVPLPIEASHVALKWRGAADADIHVAFGLKPNELGEDLELEVVDDDAVPDADAPASAKAAAAGADAYSDVIWTGGAKFVRITTDRPIGQLTVVAIDAQPDVGLAPSPAHVASADVGQPNIIPRSGWGADESLRFDSGGHEVWPPEYYPMQTAIVHHTAGRNGDPNPAATIRAIYWVKAIDRGYGDIGYNFLIDEQGRIYEGRHSRDYPPGEVPTGEDLAGNIVRGVHASNHNIGTVGIAFLGNFQKRQPTLAARTALDRLLAWKLERHGIDPLGKSSYHNPAIEGEWLYNISGHRNVNQTACPGETFYPTFPQLRQRVAARIAGTTGAGNDSKPPVVTSLTSFMTDPTGSLRLRFGLLFDEPVDGLELSDFDVSGSSHGWDVTGITGGPEGYDVWVEANNPDPGNVHLELAADAVTDLAGLTGPSDPVSVAATYDHDNDAPTVVLYQMPHKQYITNPDLNYFNVTATFSEPVTGFGADDVLLGGTSHAGDPWKVPLMFGDGADYGFGVINHSWYNGTLTFQIPEGAATDLAGNPVQASNVVTVYLDTRKPTTSVPRVSLRSGTTLADGGGLRVNVSWTGTDVGPAGVASYDVARSIDGRPFRAIAIGVTGSSLGWGVTPGHTYRFEVRARDKAGNVGYWKAGATLKPALLQQTNGNVTWSGSTKSATSSHFSGGSLRYLAAAGASATFQTTARSLSFVTTAGPGRGEVAIYVDGVYQTTIDLGAATPTYRYVAFSKWWSTAATHRIRVVAVGTPGRPRVDVDAFGVIR